MSLLKRRLHGATVHSLRGWMLALRTEEAVRVQSFLAIFLIPTAFYIATDFYQLLWLLLTIVLVVVTELLNTAIEAAIDRISDEIHPLSARAKDIGSAAVFTTMMFFLVVWCGIIYLNFFS